MIKLIWSPRAQADLARIDSYYRIVNVDFAQRVLLEAVLAAEFLLSYPQAGQKLEEKRHRRWRIAGTPYSLIYREARDGLRIVTVKHASQESDIS